MVRKLPMIPLNLLNTNLTSCRRVGKKEGEGREHRGKNGWWKGGRREGVVKERRKS